MTRGRRALAGGVALVVALGAALAVAGPRLLVQWYARALRAEKPGAAARLRALGPAGLDALESVAFGDGDGTSEAARREAVDQLALQDEALEPALPPLRRLEGYLVHADLLVSARQGPLKALEQEAPLGGEVNALLLRLALADDAARSAYAGDVLERRAKAGDAGALELLVEVARATTLDERRASAFRGLAHARVALPADVLALARRAVAEAAHRDLRSAAAQVVVARGDDPEALARPWLRDGDEAVRLGAAIGLVLARPEVVAAIARGDPDARVRRAAVVAANLHGRKGDAFLATVLHDPDEAVRLAAASMMDRVSPDAVRVAVGALRAGASVETRESGAGVLARGNCRQAVGALAAALARIPRGHSVRLSFTLSMLTGERREPAEGWAAWLEAHRHRFPPQLDADDCFRKTSAPEWTAVAPVGSR